MSTISHFFKVRPSGTSSVTDNNKSKKRPRIAKVTKQCDQFFNTNDINENNYPEKEGLDDVIFETDEIREQDATIVDETDTVLGSVSGNSIECHVEETMLTQKTDQVAPISNQGNSSGLSVLSTTKSLLKEGQQSKRNLVTLKNESSRKKSSSTEIINLLDVDDDDEEHAHEVERSKIIENASRPDKLIVQENVDTSNSEKTLTSTTNPFSKFAFGQETDKYENNQSTTKLLLPNTISNKQCCTKQSLDIPMKSNTSKLGAKHMTKNQNNKTTKNPCVSKSGCGGSNEKFVPVRNLNEAEKQAILKKWHSFIDPSITDIEIRRFHLFVATRIHARCQDSSVRKAMNKLNDAFLMMKKKNEEGVSDSEQQKSVSTTTALEASSSATSTPFTVQTIAQCDCDTIADIISNLQYHNTKAKHLIQASNEIITKFSGFVPEKESDLKQLIGIGPIFADLLSFVNTRDIHKSYLLNSRDAVVHNS